MKQNYLLKNFLLIVFICFACAAKAVSITENFEGGPKGATIGYKTETVVTFGTGTTSWAIRGYAAMDLNDRHNGANSIRLRGKVLDPADDNYITLKTEKVGGVGNVNFTYGSYSTNSGGQLQVYYSVDGTSWIAAGDVITAPAWASTSSMSSASVAVNSATAKFIKIAKIIGVGGSVNVDDIEVTDYNGGQVSPSIGVATALNFATIAVPSESNLSATSQALAVVGASLSSPITYAISGANASAFSAVGTLTADGGSVNVTFTPTTFGSYAATLTLTSGTVTKDVQLTGKVVKSVAANLAELRGFVADNKTVYTLTGKAIVTFTTVDRNTKYIQDETGAILIDDNSKKIATAFVAGDEISGLAGTLVLYNGMLQFTPSQDAVKGESGKIVTPIVKSLATLTVADQAKLVKVTNVTFAMTDSKDAPVTAFTKGISYKLVGSDLVVRAQYSDLPYLTSDLPTTAQDITGVVLLYNTTIQLIPRLESDIIVHEKGSGISVEKLAGIYTADHKLYVPATAGEQIFIINALGQTVSVATAHEGINELSNLPVNKLLIVKVGNRAAKVVL